MSQLSPDGRAIVRICEQLSTQVRRIADALSTTTDAPSGYQPTGVRPEPTTAPDTPSPIAASCAWHPNAPVIGGLCGGCTQYPADMRPAPAADEDALRTTRRVSLRVLINRVNNGTTLTPDEAQLLARHVATEICDANTARAVAAGNKRHVQVLVPELEAHAKENEQLLADLHRLRAELEQMRDLLTAENKRANDAIDREHTAEQDADEQRRRADQADAVTAEAKRLLERRTTTLRERAERAEAAIERVRALADRWDRDAPPLGNRPLTELRAALDGTEQPKAPTTEPN